MQKVTDFVIKMANECNDVQEWLQENMDFSPEIQFSFENSSIEEYKE